jgi:hypothetical protein
MHLRADQGNQDGSRARPMTPTNGASILGPVVHQLVLVTKKLVEKLFWPIGDRHRMKVGEMSLEQRVEQGRLGHSIAGTGIVDQEFLELRQLGYRKTWM